VTAISFTLDNLTRRYDFNGVMELRYEEICFFLNSSVLAVRQQRRRPGRELQL
jgi:hypothetical protein